MFTNPFARACAALALTISLGFTADVSALPSNYLQPATGPITLSTGDGSVHGYKDWAEDKGGFRITSDVEKLGNGRWEYSYHITSNIQEGSGYADLGEQLFEFWLEVSPGWTLDEIIIPGTYSDQGEAASYALTGGPFGEIDLEIEQGVTEAMHAIGFTMNPDDAASWWFSFESYRAPTLGDFYARNLCDQEFPDLSIAYNWGFPEGECTDESCIWVPDSAVIPEPSTYAMLGLLLVITFFFQRKRQRQTA